MFRYMQEAYWGTIPWLNEVKINEKWEMSFGGWSDAESIKMFKLWLLAEVADLEAVNFNRDMLKTVWGRILADVSDEHVAKKTMEYFNMVDEMKSVSDNWKEIAKATVLYWNLNRMKILLNSKYAPWMVDEMDKLAEIIWKESGKIELNPELLDWLWNWSWYWKKWKWKWVKFKWPDFKFQKDVIDWIKDLKETAYNNPQLKPNLMRVAWKNTDAKLKQLNLPTIPKRDGQDYKPKELTPMKIKPIEPAEIEVKKAWPEIKKFKYKFAKDKPIKKKWITRAKTSWKTTRISKP